MVSLKNLDNSTSQEVFDHIVSHLRTQNAKAFHFGKQDCVYRLFIDGKVLRCAAGCLIADDEYRPEFDQGLQSWPTLVSKFGLSTNHRSLIFDMQKIHDGENIEDWEFGFQRVAQHYGLHYKTKSE